MKKVICFVVTFLFVQLGMAQEEKTLLWRVSGNGLASPSYIFGTIHLICPADYVWTDKMQKALESCNKVCFEMDMDDPATMSAATEGFMADKGKKMKDYFKPADYTALKKFMHDSMGVDIVLFQGMKPIALESIISMKSVPCNDAISYEEKIMGKAKEEHKEVLGLEAASEQISALDSTPPDSVAAEIMELVSNFTKSRLEFSEMVNAYKVQDLKLLYKKIAAAEGMGNNIGVLLNDRNKRWIPRMKQKMAGNAVFFAVGAGHLAGDKGVLSLLKQAGFTVEPVL